MKIVTAAEMREIDRLTTEKYGVPSLTLMENAGSAVAEFAQKHFDFKSVCVVCGKGNNGGDGFVAARKLHEAGKQVAVIILAKSAEELRGDAAEMFKKLPVASLWVSEEEHFSRDEIQQALKAELIVDAILGTGFKPRIQGIPARAVDVINRLKSPVLGVDVPSGVDADAKKPIESDMPYVDADAVITFTAPKPVHVFEDLTEGPVAVAPIGSPLELIHAQSSFGQEVLSLGELGSSFPRRKPKAHKGEFGHVLVVGGSVGKAGAAGMAGMAALATGAGLVTVACPRSIQPTVASYAPELMTEALPETMQGTIAGEAISRLVELCEGKDCLAIGPGLSRNPETAEVIRKLVASTPVSVVLDADGLNAFSSHAAELSGELRIEDMPVQRMLVLTPHPGEMSRLAGISIHDVEKNRLKVATDFAQSHKSIVVLKGHRTIISSFDGSAFVNVTGNPGMAKGGSGDVLTGITAALAARLANRSFSIPLEATSEDKIVAGMVQEYMKSRNPQLGEALGRKIRPQIQGKKNEMRLVCAATAVCLHSFAGDLARTLYGEYSMTATQIIESVGEAIAVAQKHASSPLGYLRI